MKNKYQCRDICPCCKKAMLTGIRAYHTGITRAAHYCERHWWIRAMTPHGLAVFYFDYEPLANNALIKFATIPKAKKKK